MDKAEMQARAILKGNAHRGTHLFSQDGDKLADFGLGRLGADLLQICAAKEMAFLS